MENQWVTWALQGLIGFILWLVWQQLSKNTDAINKIQVDLPTNYVTKNDFNGFRTYHTEKNKDSEARLKSLEEAKAFREGAELGRAP